MDTLKDNQKHAELFRKLSEDVRAAIETRTSTKECQEFIASMKAAPEDETGRFKVVISTEDVDRHGESILLEGWDISFYERNPVVLWAHDYSDFPIGISEKVYKEDGKLVSEGRFAPAAANPKAQQVRALYDAGMLNATSVGCIVQEMKGNVITKAQLLEFSFVPVPANPFALRLNEMKFDAGDLVAKGLLLGEDKREENIAEKEGRVLSKKNRELINSAIEPMKASIAALETLLTATEPEGGEAQKADDGAAPKQRSRAAGSGESELFNQWLMSKQVLRAVNNATSEALASFNRASKNK